MSSKAPWLCPPEVTKTNVPLLSSLSSQTSTGQTIDVVACSEFKEHTAQVTHVEADPSHKLRLFFTGAYQPIVFSVGKDARLYCIQHVTGDTWKPFDITPQLSCSIITFEAFQRSDGLLSIAAAVTSGSDDSRLFYAHPFSVADQTFDASKVQFTEIERPSSMGAILISSITMAAKDVSAPDGFLLIGTHSTSTKVGNDYLINITPSISWRTLSLYNSAAEAVKAVAVTLRKPYNACTAVLSRSAGQTTSSCDQLRCISLDPGENYNKEVHLGHIGSGAYDVAVTSTPAGLSDIYVAGLKGIGYYTGYDPTGDPIVIMEDMSFKQIIASEKAGEIDGGKGISEVTIFAVTDDGSMYFVKGQREYVMREDKTGYWKKAPTFTTTAVPIRTNVGFVSTRHNPSLSATEAVYVSTLNQQVHHIVRDPSSTLWAGTVLRVKWKEEVVFYYAFETRIRLQGSSGTAVGTGYPLKLSSEQITYALVNDKSYRLSSSPTTVETDGSGCISVIIAADASISAPTLTFRLESIGHSHNVVVDPRRRVALKWQYMPSGSELKNARSTKGEPIFPNTTISDETFNALAEMLQIVLKQKDTNNPAAVSLVAFSAVAFQGTPASNISMLSVWDWIKDAVVDVGKFLGDAIESVGHFLENAASSVKKVIKTGIAIFEGVVNFVANIAGKVIRWALDTAGAVIRGAITVLKDTLGLDLTRFMALFGFLLDYDNILRTQKVISDTALKGAKYVQSSMKLNVSAVKEMFKGMKASVSPYIKDQRSSEETNVINWSNLATLFDKTPFGYVLKIIIDNPITDTLRKILLKCINIVVPLLDEFIHLPGLDDLQNLTGHLVDVLRKLIASEATNVSNYIKDVLTKLAEVVTGARSFGEIITAILSDAFWTVIDALQGFAEAIFDIISDIVDCVITMITGVVDIPGISAWWQGYTKLPFSLLNVVTLNLAHVLYLITMEAVEKLPFDVMPKWDSLIPEAEHMSFSPSSDASLREGSSLVSRRLILALETQSAERSEPTVKHWTSDRSRDLWCTILMGVPIMCATAMDMDVALGAPASAGIESIPLNTIGGGEPQPAAATTPRPAPTAIGARCLKWGKVALVGFSLTVEIGWFYAMHKDALDNREPSTFPMVCQLTAAVLKSVDLIATIGGQNTWFTALFPPLGNWIGNLPSLVSALEQMTEGWDKVPGAYVVLISAEAGMSSAVCDATTVWAAETKQLELAPVTLGSSFLLCMGQAIIGCGLVISN